MKIEKKIILHKLKYDNNIFFKIIFFEIDGRSIKKTVKSSTSCVHLCIQCLFECYAK